MVAQVGALQQELSMERWGKEHEVPNQCPQPARSLLFVPETRGNAFELAALLQRMGSTGIGNGLCAGMAVSGTEIAYVQRSVRYLHGAVCGTEIAYVQRAVCGTEIAGAGGGAGGRNQHDDRASAWAMSPRLSF
eukprot:697060-Rhodomonas_salina.1